MNRDEAFEAWYGSDDGDDSYNKNQCMDAWKAAWDARGKHDAEVCRSEGKKFHDGVDAWDAGYFNACEACVKTIEEQE